MITVSNNIQGFIAVIALIVLYEIVKWAVRGIIQDIKQLRSIKADK